MLIYYPIECYATETFFYCWISLNCDERANIFVMLKYFWMSSKLLAIIIIKPLFALFNILFSISNKNGANSPRGITNVSNSLLLVFILSKKTYKTKNEERRKKTLPDIDVEKFRDTNNLWMSQFADWIRSPVYLNQLYRIMTISKALNTIYFKTIDFWGSSFSRWQRMSSSSITFNGWLFLFYYFYHIKVNLLFRSKQWHRLIPFHTFIIYNKMFRNYELRMWTKILWLIITRKIVNFLMKNNEINMYLL